MEDTNVHHVEQERTGFRVSWGGILGGLFVALGVEIILSLIILAVSAATATGGGASGALGFWDAIGESFVFLIALFVGGLVAGHMAGILTRWDGVLHGLVVWGLAVFLGLIFGAVGAGIVVGNVFNVVAQVSGPVAGQVAGSALQGTRELTRENVERVLAGVPPGPSAPQARPLPGGAVADPGLADTIVSRVKAGASREQIASLIEKRTGATAEEARRLSGQIESMQQVPNLPKQTLPAVRRSVNLAGNVVSTLAWWAFATIAAGAVTASLGAALTARS